MKKKKELWLYHPGLDIPERGFTGYYRPAGLCPKTNIPQIEILQKMTKSKPTSPLIGEASKERWEGEFDDKWGSELWVYRHNGGDVARAINTCEEVKSFIRQVRQEAIKEERERIARQLEMTVLFGERQTLGGASVIDWPSRIRTFIRYELKAKIKEMGK